MIKNEEEMIKLSFDMSDIFFIPRSDLHRYELFTPDVNDCAVLIIEGEEGIVGTHRLRTDNSTNLTKFIKEKLSNSEFVNLCITGGNFTTLFIKPDKISYRELNFFHKDMYQEMLNEKFNYENLLKIMKDLNLKISDNNDELNEGLKEGDEDFFPKPIPLKIRNSSGIRNILHVINAVKKSEKKIKDFNFQKMHYNPCDVYINFDKEGKVILKAKKRNEIDEEFIKSFKSMPEEMMAKIVGKKRMNSYVNKGEYDSSDYDSEIEKLTNKEVLNIKSINPPVSLNF